MKAVLLEYDVWLEFKVCDELEVKVGEVGGGGSGTEGGGIEPLRNGSCQPPSGLVGDIGISVRGMRGLVGRGVLAAGQVSASYKAKTLP